RITGFHGDAVAVFATRWSSRGCRRDRFIHASAVFVVVDAPARIFIKIFNKAWRGERVHMRDDCGFSHMNLTLFNKRWHGDDNSEFLWTALKVVRHCENRMLSVAYK